MKIGEIHIDGFGTWRDLTLSEFGDGVTVIYGPNEAGKTTLMQFIRSVMYGLNPYRRQRYLPPLRGGRPGGSLAIRDDNATFRVVRHGHIDDPPGMLGDVTVVAADGMNFGSGQLDSLLAGVDEATFSNVFALGLREIQELGSLDDTAAADHLYRLTGGLDRVSLVDVVRELQGSRQKILGTHDKPGQVATLTTRRNKLREELRELSARTDRWLKLATLRSELQHEADQLDREITLSEERARIMDVALQARELWNQRRALNERLTKLGKPRRVPKQLQTRLQKFNERIAQNQAKVADIKGRRGKIVAQGQAIKINRAIWSQAARIEALTEHAGWVENLENQIERLKNELRGHESALQTQTVSAGSPGFDVSLANQQTLQALRRPQKAIHEEEARLERAKRDATDLRTEFDTLVAKIDQRLTERNETDLQTALQNAGERIQILRRRMQLETRLEQIARHREELENYLDDLFQRHVMPLWITIGLGVAFATGIMLILFMFVCYVLQWNIVTEPLPLVVIGFALTLLSAGGKVGLERQTSLKLDALRRQLAQVHRQHSELQQQRDELDEALPRGAGSLEVRLTRAEEDLRRLEELLPLQTQRDTLKARADAAAKAELEADNALKEARSRYKSVLRSLGLPDNYSPNTIRQFATKGEEISQTRRQWDVVRDELQQRERELLSLATRIDQLMGDIRLKPESDRPRDRLAQLSKALEAQRDLDFQRSELRRQVREFRKEYEGSRKLVRRDQRSREQIFEKLGLRNEKEFDKAVARWKQFRVLTVRCEKLTHKIAGVVMGRITDDQLDAELAPREDNATLESRREEIAARVREHRIRLGQVHEKRGQSQQEMANLADDRRLDEVKTELGCLERQIAGQVRQWQSLAATEQILTSVRKIYETHRQPETLREASEYLKQLTSGHYTRLWTPLEDRTLRVDDAEGKPVRLEVLSRGTREAIFLSLRLALVNSFARRGARLPLVLDDVLVNFDTSRVKSAAQVLRDFAKDHGHQIIFFTCHEHIMRIFKGVKVDVRTLPGHEIPADLEPERPKRKRVEPEPVVEVIEAPKPIIAEVEIPPVIAEPEITIVSNIKPPKQEIELLLPPPPKAKPEPPPAPPPPPKPTPETLEIIPDFHENAFRLPADNRVFADLWSVHMNDVYGVEELPPEKPRQSPPPRAVVEKVVEKPVLTKPQPVAVLERPTIKRRARFAWESPERYVEYAEDEAVD